MIKRAKEVLRIEAAAISSLIGRIDNNFEKAVKIILACRGKAVVTGMGKPGFIGAKISATFSSTGTPSLYLHPADAIHGDLGRVTKDDVVLAISNSGETEEIIRLLPTLKKIGARIIAMTGNKKSTLARYSDVTLDVAVNKEACPLNLAPTASTTAMLAMGDALAIALLDRRGFKEEDFAFYHPGGSLGKRLVLKVEDIMRKGKASPVVKEDLKIKDVLLRITEARAGSASVVNGRGALTGIFTDGDLRRHLATDPLLSSKPVKQVMTKNPVTISKDLLAADAFRILRERKIDEIPVVDSSKKPIGLVDVQDLLKAGLV
ncbi:MAG: KpsF/GutQ family sugar-phosphate isomerase [Candidatus Omnitrophota bacterium]|jgi:arabinose-5-phosphate isomerase